MINLVETFNCHKLLSEMNMLDLGSEGSYLQTWHYISEFVFEVDFVAHFKSKYKPSANKETIMVKLWYRLDQGIQQWTQ